MIKCSASFYPQAADIPWQRPALCSLIHNRLVSSLVNCGKMYWSRMCSVRVNYALLRADGCFCGRRFSKTTNSSIALPTQYDIRADVQWFPPNSSGEYARPHLTYRHTYTHIHTHTQRTSFLQFPLKHTTTYIPSITATRFGF